MNSRFRPLSVVLSLVILVISGCSSETPETKATGSYEQPPEQLEAAAESPATPKNLLLITIDTLRADRCSSYGNPHRTTPVLDSLATRGQLFEQAYAASSWTPPSMASIFTGRPPRAHGVIHGAVRDGGVYGQQYLDESLPTIASELSRQGFFCVGVSSNTHLGHKTGFARGFDRFEELFWEDAEAVTQKAQELIQELPAGQRYFLWVHLIDPHTAYHAREPWIAEYGGDPEWIKKWDGTEVKTVRQDLKQGAAGDRAAETLRALYDSEVAYADHAIGRLIEDLPQKEQTLIAVTSDHGEALLEHQAFGHGSSLYEEQIRVPLVLAGPGVGAGRRIQTPVSNTGLMPTLLEILGFDSPGPLASGSLVSLQRDERAPAAFEDAVFTELDRNNQRAFTVRQGPFKLYRRLRPRPSAYLFDLTKDPQETHDLLALEPAALTDLMARWRAWQEQWPRFEASQVVMGDIDSDEAERLRSLGYLGQ